MLMDLSLEVTGMYVFCSSRERAQLAMVRDTAISINRATIYVLFRVPFI